MDLPGRGPPAGDAAWRECRSRGCPQRFTVSLESRRAVYAALKHSQLGAEGAAATLHIQNVGFVKKQAKSSYKTLLAVVQAQLLCTLPISAWNRSPQWGRALHVSPPSQWSTAGGTSCQQKGSAVSSVVLEPSLGVCRVNTLTDRVMFLIMVSTRRLGDPGQTSASNGNAAVPKSEHEDLLCSVCPLVLMHFVLLRICTKLKEIRMPVYF